MKMIKLIVMLAPAMILSACVSTPESNTASQPSETEPARPPIVVKSEQAQPSTNAQTEQIKLDIAKVMIRLQVVRDNRRNAFPAEDKQIMDSTKPLTALLFNIFGGDHWHEPVAILTEGGTISGLAEKIKQYVIYPAVSETQRNSVVTNVSEVLRTHTYLDAETKGTLCLMRDKYYSN